MDEKIFRISIEEERIPFNGGFTVCRMYLDDGTTSIEITHCCDCRFHLLSLDQKCHFCIGADPDGTAILCNIDAEHTFGLCCNYVCEVRKTAFRDALLQYPFDDGTREFLESYIEKPNDTPFDQTAAVDIIKESGASYTNLIGG